MHHHNDQKILHQLSMGRNNDHLPNIYEMDKANILASFAFANKKINLHLVANDNTYFSLRR